MQRRSISPTGGSTGRSKCRHIDRSMHGISLGFLFVVSACTNYPSNHTKMVYIQPLIVLHPPHYCLIWICRFGLHPFLFHSTDFFSSLYLAVAWSKGWSRGLFELAHPSRATPSKCPTIQVPYLTQPDGIWLRREGLCIANGEASH